MKNQIPPYVDYRRWTAIILIALGLSTQSVDGQDSTFCVFELFTSEGCSSCPYGDDVLNTDAINAENSNDNHLYLSCHIEYWDYLGWTDPYGMALHDNMFFGYYNNGNGITFGSSSGFGTPMFVRNGEFGTNFTTPLQEKTASSYVVLNHGGLTGNQLTVNYEISGDLTDSEFHLFVVERGISSVVTAGENAGKTLDHENVVRVHEVLGTQTTQGNVTVTLPQDAVVSNMRVMGYIRKATNSPWSRDVTGATKGYNLSSVDIQEPVPSFIAVVYPNPANEVVRISVDEAQQIKQLDLYSIDGQLVNTEQVTTGSVAEVRTGSLEVGSYFVQGITGKGVQFHGSVVISH